jgi:hypothetical protein
VRYKLYASRWSNYVSILVLYQIDIAKPEGGMCLEEWVFYLYYRGITDFPVEKLGMNNLLSCLVIWIVCSIV